MRSDVENKETSLNKLIELIDDNIDTRNQQNLNIFITDIYLINGKYKVQVKKLCYYEKYMCFEFEPLEEIKVNGDSYSIYTLWPYFIDSEMLIDYNKHEINEYKNLDTKLFDCEKYYDIYNIKITLCNAFRGYEYVFVRMVEKDEDKLVVRYIGIYQEIGQYNKIWMVKEYNFVKIFETYVSCNLTDSNKIENFFISLKSILTQNSVKNYRYYLWNYNSCFDNRYVDRKLSFKTYKTHVLFHEHLCSVFSKLKEKGWIIEIIDKRHEVFDYSKTRIFSNFYPPNLNAVEYTETSQMWKQWSTDQTDDLKKSFSKYMYARFSNDNFGYQIQIYIKIETDLAYVYDGNRKEFNNALKAKLNKFIENEELSFSFDQVKFGKKEFDFYFNCNEFINNFFNRYYGSMHGFLLVDIDQRLKFFKLELSNYILRSFKECNIIDKQTYLSMENKCSRECFMFLNEDSNIYATSYNGIEKKNYYNSTLFFNLICECFSFTENDKQKLNKILKAFCDFYDQLQVELTEKKINCNSDFYVYMRFLTFLPQHLKEDILNDLGPILKN
ncbi:hypothetical protein COBT_002315 [Conglomerata obtusa]